jgi:hypothetical protein
MIPAIPRPIELIVLATNLAIAGAVWWLVASTARRTPLSASARRAVQVGSAVFIGAWLGAALLLAPPPASLVNRDRFYLSPLFPLFALIPPALGALALALWPTLRRTIAAVPLPALVGIQLYRIVGVVFLILLAQGQLPGHFALPAGWGDVVIGLAAPLVALALLRGIPNARGLAAGWNLLGLLDLAVAVGMGTGYLAPLLTDAVGRLPPAGAMGVFPLILVPTFAVPVSVVLHLLALSRLIREIRLGSSLMQNAVR